MFPQHWWRTHWSSRQHQDALEGRSGGSWRSKYTTLDRFPDLARWCCCWCCTVSWFIACTTWWPRQRCSGECQACHSESSRCSQPLVQKVLKAWYKEDRFPTSREMLDLLYRGQGPEVGHASPKVLPDLVIYPGFGRLLQPRVTYSDSVSQSFDLSSVHLIPCFGKIIHQAEPNSSWASSNENHLVNHFSLKHTICNKYQEESLLTNAMKCCLLNSELCGE